MPNKIQIGGLYFLLEEHETDVRLGLIGHSNGATLNNFKIINNLKVNANSEPDVNGTNIGDGINIVVNNLANARVGSLVGSGNATITNSLVEGVITINGNAGYVGAVAGYADNRTIILNTGSNIDINVNGNTSYVGGLVGRLESSSSLILNSYAAGDININGPSTNVGGIVGGLHHSATIKNAYYGGVIATNETPVNAGNIVGFLEEGYSHLENVYYQSRTGTTVSRSYGNDSNSVGDGRINTGQHANVDQYNGFNFAMGWEMDSSIGPVRVVVAESTAPGTTFEDEGNGTENNPWIIRSDSQLLRLVNFLNDETTSVQNTYNTPSVFYELKGNINIVNNRAFTVINNFRANLNGNGFSISGVYIYNFKTPSGNNYLGMINNLHGTIKNLNISAELMYSRYGSAIGGVVGAVQATGKLINTTLTNNVIAFSNYTGGIAGVSYGAIYQTSFNGLVNAVSGVAGILGELRVGNINNSFNDPFNFITNSFVGVSESINLGRVAGGREVGGIIGRVATYKADVNTENKLVASNIYNRGLISGTGSRIGGIVGNLYKSYIKHAYNHANIIKNNSSTNVGEIIGSTENNQSSNLVFNHSGANRTGIVNANSILINNTQTGVGSGSVLSSVAASTSEMQTLNYWNSGGRTFNFNTIWTMYSEGGTPVNNGLPVLRFAYSRIISASVKPEVVGVYNGTISATYNGITYSGTSIELLVLKNESLQVSFTPNANYHMVGLEVDGAAITDPVLASKPRETYNYLVTVSDNSTNLVAEFAINTYRIFLTASVLSDVEQIASNNLIIEGNAKVLDGGVYEFDYNELVTLRAINLNRLILKEVKLNGQVIDTDLGYTLTASTETSGANQGSNSQVSLAFNASDDNANNANSETPVVYEFVFAKQYEVNFAVNPDNNVNKIEDITGDYITELEAGVSYLVEHGESITAKATADSSYEFAGWQANETPVENGTETQEFVIETNTDIVAMFTIALRTVDIITPKGVEIEILITGGHNFKVNGETISGFTHTIESSNNDETNTIEFAFRETLILTLTTTAGYVITSVENELDFLFIEHIKNGNNSLVWQEHTFEPGINITKNHKDTITITTNREMWTDTWLDETGQRQTNWLPYAIEFMSNPQTHGAGISNNPFKASSGQDLALIANLVAGRNGLEGFLENMDVVYMRDVYIEITQDIDLSAKLWNPIGNATLEEIFTDTSTNVFAGILLGNGHTISNIYIDNSSSDKDEVNLGFFGTFAGEAQDLKLTNINYTSTTNNDVTIGGFAGVMGGNIANIAVENSEISVYNAQTAIIGGLVGLSIGQIENTYTASMQISSNNNSTAIVGGLVGSAEDTIIRTSYTSLDLPAIGQIENIYSVSIYNIYDNSTTSSLGNEATFEGFDFNSVWAIDYSANNPLNNGHPVLYALEDYREIAVVVHNQNNLDLGKVVRENYDGSGNTTHSQDYNTSQPEKVKVLQDNKVIFNLVPTSTGKLDNYTAVGGQEIQTSPTTRVEFEFSAILSVANEEGELEVWFVQGLIGLTITGYINANGFNIPQDLTITGFIQNLTTGRAYFISLTHESVQEMMLTAGNYNIVINTPMLFELAFSSGISGSGSPQNLSNNFNFELQAVGENEIDITITKHSEKWFYNTHSSVVETSTETVEGNNLNANQLSLNNNPPLMFGAMFVSEELDENNEQAIENQAVENNEQITENQTTEINEETTNLNELAFNETQLQNESNFTNGLSTENTNNSNLQNNNSTLASESGESSNWLANLLQGLSNTILLIRRKLFVVI